MTAPTAQPGPARVRLMTINMAVDLYLNELAGRGMSARTIARYQATFDGLGNMFPFKDVDEVTITDLRRYLGVVQVNKKNRQQNSAATVAQAVSTIKTFFRWLHDEEYIPEDPAVRLKRPKLKRPEDNDGIVMVSMEDVQRMMAACETWAERICLHVLVYTGARRRAVAQLRLSDWDATASPPTIRFREKGGKIIKKPVAAKLNEVLMAAFSAGVWETGEGKDPWLIPPRGAAGWAQNDQYGERRDDRVVWKIVKTVAARAGVHAHVHALRAAFAVHFLEAKPNQVVALQRLLGHDRLETTQVYLRRLDRMKSMEAVLDLDWDVKVEAAPRGKSAASTFGRSRDGAAHHAG